MAGLWPLLASGSFWLGIRAQTTDAICIESYAWAYNSYGQSPCRVAAYLQQQCISAPVNIPALRQNAFYAAPTSNATNTSCECSSVVYSLMSACASCQLGNYLSWSAWSTNCTTVYMNVFPKVIPVETDVPGWAYSFDLAVAFIFKGISFNTTAARLSVAGSRQPESKENSVSPVLYGIIGAACAFTLVALVGGGVLLWRRRHRYRIGRIAPQKYSPLHENNPMGSLYSGIRIQSSEYGTYKETSVPGSPPPIITEFRNSRQLTPAPSIRSAVSLPSFDSPGGSHEYSPAMESSQGTTHGEHPTTVISGENSVPSVSRQSPIIPIPRPESRLLEVP